MNQYLIIYTIHQKPSTILYINIEIYVKETGFNEAEKCSNTIFIFPLTYLMPLISIYTSSWKHEKNLYCSDIFRRIQRDQYHKIGFSAIK